MVGEKRENAATKTEAYTFAAEAAKELATL